MTARRRVVSALGIAVLAPSLTSLAQPPKSQTRIGFLPLGSPTSNYDRSLVDAFRQGLREFALIENRDVIVDVVWVGNESGAGSVIATATAPALATNRLLATGYHG